MPIATSTSIIPTVPVITTNKVPTIVGSEPTPLNVSIRLPDDINERKNLIKRNLVSHSNDMKFSDTIKFGADVKKELGKVDCQIPLKSDRDVTAIKDEQKVDMPDKFKTELIIPKVTMEKVIIKEELESSNEAISLSSRDDYKDNIFLSQNMNIKEQLNFSLKDTHLSHLQSIDVQDPLERSKDLSQSVNGSSYLKDIKAEPYLFNQKEQTHIINAVVKLEPRDEPMELTNSSRSDLFNQSMTAQTLNIPTVIPMSQMQNSRPEQSHFADDEKREKLDRPERVERPERNDLTIGQPPLPNIMQSANLVTIGGQSGMNHYGYMPYSSHSPRNLDKNIPTSQPLLPSQMGQQMEPQNLKIKQEIPESSSSQSSAGSYIPYSQTTLTSSTIQNSNTYSSVPSPQISSTASLGVTSSSMVGYGVQGAVQNLQVHSSDPLQSLKDVKVPGFSLPSVVAQSMPGERPSSGPIIDGIKKELDFSSSSISVTSASPVQSIKSPAPKGTSSTPTPSINLSQTPPLRQSSK